MCVRACFRAHTHDYDNRKGDNPVSGKDLFADEALGGLDKYKQRNEQTLRQERAEELDERILAFYNRTHDLAWAGTVADFCTTETIQNEDVFDLSNEVHRLEKMKREAELILERHRQQLLEEKRRAEEAARAEAARRAEEKRRAEEAARAEAARKAEQERQARLAAEQAKRDAIAAAAKKVDDMIETLEKAPRSRYWCDEVQSLDTEVKELARESRVLCRKLPVLEKLLVELRAVEAAVSFDERIGHYKKVEYRRRDLTWCEEVMQLPKKITPTIRTYLQKGDVLQELVQQANERKIEIQNEERRAKEEAIKRDRQTRVNALVQKLRGCEDLLKRSYISMTDMEAALNRTKELRSAQTSLGFKISEFQADFITRLDKVEQDFTERIARTRREMEQRRREEAARARKRAIRNAFLRWGVPLILCILGAILFRGTELGRWLVGGAVGFALIALRFIFPKQLPVKGGGRIAVDCILSGVALVLLLLGVHHIGAGIALCLALFSLFVRSDSTMADLLDFMISGSVFAVALGFIVDLHWADGIWGALVAGIVIAGIQIAFSIVAMIVEDDDWMTFHIIFNLCLVAVSTALIFITRELSFAALAMLGGCAVVGFIQVIGYPDRYYDTETLESVGGTAMGWGIIMLVFSLCWSFSVWGLNPVGIVEDGNAVVYRLDRSDGTITVPDMGGDTYWIKKVNAPNATTIIIENGVTTLGEESFRKCDDVETVYIPSSVQEIEQDAFKKCKNLKTVYIGYDADGTPSELYAKLNRLEYNVFGDTAVKTIYFNGTTRDWNNINFVEKNKNKDWDHNMEPYKVVCINGTLQ